MRRISFAGPAARTMPIAYSVQSSDAIVHPAAGDGSHPSTPIAFIPKFSEKWTMLAMSRLPPVLFSTNVNRMDAEMAASANDQ